MTLYSQRDEKWRYDLMGTGTIGAFGCTITCIGMLCDVTPDIINAELKNVKGYDGNYLIWDKVDLIKNLDFIKRVKYYDNADVLANLPCLVEVDGAPIGGFRHWVLYVGDHQLYDPWDGVVKPTSTYNPVGYAVIKYNKPALVPEPISLVRDTPPSSPEPIVGVEAPEPIHDPDFITPVSELPKSSDVIPVPSRPKFFQQIWELIKKLLGK